LPVSRKDGRGFPERAAHHDGENQVSSDGPHNLTRLLSSVPYFAHLDATTLNAVARGAVRRHYAKGETVFLEGDPCAGLCVVEKGRIRLLRLSVEGREQVVKLLRPGEFFNEVAVLDGGPNPVSAMAATESILWVIDGDTMVRLLNRYPALAAAVIENLASRARHLLSLVEDLSLRTVSARLAKLLLAQAGGGREAPRRLTQQEMAAQVGTVREMVSRVLRRFEEEGLIRFERHRIVLLDREGLEREAKV
jgi:CRP/FNR family transcriptional regulator